jgi:hypothetical protein
LPFRGEGGSLADRRGFRRVRRLFERLLELEPPERARRLAELGRSEPALARDLVTLLAADDGASRLLDEDALRFFDLFDLLPAAGPGGAPEGESEP